MLGEIDIVMRRDQRDARTLALRRPVQALARVSADFRARPGGRGQADELRVAGGREFRVLGARGATALTAACDTPWLCAKARLAVRPISPAVPMSAERRLRSCMQSSRCLPQARAARARVNGDVARRCAAA
jgi:hypothetical protein